jgi:hypothetical protein
MSKEYDLTHLHGLWLFVIFILMLGGAYLLVQRGTSQIPHTEIVAPVPTIDLSTVPLFAQSLAASGITVNNLGYHAFTPDGKYFVFTGITDADEIPAKTYLVRLSDGVITKLPGILLGDVRDSRVVVLTDGEDMVIYDIEHGTEKRIPAIDNVFAGSLSPDGRTYVFDTQNGIRAYDMQHDTLAVVSNGQYDGASAWYQDSQYMLGYHETGENLMEAGKGRVFGRWNIPAKTFEPMADGAVKQKTIRNVTWITLGKIARVNAGYDDGSFDTLVDIHSGKSIDLGDTSSALAGGMKEDAARNLFALVTIDESSGAPRAVLYKGLEKIGETAVLPNYVRSYIQIVNDHTLLYLRQRITDTGPRNSIELVKLDISTGAITPIKTFTSSFAVLSLAPDYKTWVVATKDRFYTGVLE